MRIPKIRQQAGDTIVEVMICIGIVGIVITGAFVVANKSAAAVQDSNEHSKAELHLQSQVEQFKSYVNTPGVSLPVGAGIYCMSSTATPPLVNAATNPAACTLPDGGANFKVTMARVTGNTYKFEIKWDSIRGGISQLSYVYSVYPG